LFGVTQEPPDAPSVGWERIAVVTDADWIENCIKAFGWMMPGEVKVFDDDEVDEAKRWLTESD
jgi:hypothetical protein